MEVYEIAGYATGVSRAGVNFLQPKDSFQNIENGYIYRQELKSRLGFVQFSDGRLSDQTRVMGIFEHILPNNTKDLLAISKNFLYKYNDITNHFDQIPMAGAAPIGGFAISGDDSYVSGTSYPTKTNTQRFIFTSRGMTDIYFYDGTDVKVFTNAADNPDYQAPAAGTLSKAQYVAWFGERLNFFAPFINGTPNLQMVLYSGIRDTAGNGDKFNVPGAGTLAADTFDYMTGAVIPGDYMFLAFNRSNYTLEKTRDAFNPYFIRKIPSVLGTDANFSSVSWNNQTMSVGKTGLLITDGRESLRRDDKIPYFTADNIDQVNFNYTYGGFDRVNAQFLFAYLSSSSNSTEITQDKVLTFNYEEHTWSVNDTRFSVFGQTDKGINLAWNDIYEVNNPAWARMDETEEIWNQIGIGQSVQKTLAGDNDGFIYELNADYDDYFVSITNITQASSAILTIADSAFRVGDVVSFTNVQGMTEINGLIATITAASSTSITVNVDSTLFTAYTTGGAVIKVIDFSAETVPFNPFRGEGRKVNVSHIEFLLNTNAGDLRVNLFADEETTPFKKDVLLSPDDTLIGRQWITCIVNQESNFITVEMTGKNPGSQVIITSIRIHCDRGGFTSG